MNKEFGEYGLKHNFFPVFQDHVRHVIRSVVFRDSAALSNQALLRGIHQHFSRQFFLSQSDHFESFIWTCGLKQNLV